MAREIAIIDSAISDVDATGIDSAVNPNGNTDRPTCADFAPRYHSGCDSAQKRTLR